MLAAKRNNVSKLTEKIQEVSAQHKVRKKIECSKACLERKWRVFGKSDTNKFNEDGVRTRKNKCKRGNIKAKSICVMLKFERVNDLESQLKNANERLSKLEADIDVHSSFVQNIDDSDQVDNVIAKLEKDNHECRSDIEKTRTQLKELSQKADATEQILM